MVLLYWLGVAFQVIALIYASLEVRSRAAQLKDFEGWTTKITSTGEAASDSDGFVPLRALTQEEMETDLRLTRSWVETLSKVQDHHASTLRGVLKVGRRDWVFVAIGLIGFALAAVAGMPSSPEDFCS